MHKSNPINKAFLILNLLIINIICYPQTKIDRNLCSNNDLGFLSIHENEIQKLNLLQKSRLTYIGNLSIDTVSQREFNREDKIGSIFMGIGYTPVKFNIGIGYFFTKYSELNVQYNKMYFPLTLDIDVFSFGINIYKKNSFTIYSITAGMTFSKKPMYSLDGFCFELSLGYLIETNSGFYFLPNIKTGGIFREQENSRLIIGVDLSLGWYIK